MEVECYNCGGPIEFTPEYCCTTPASMRECDCGGKPINEPDYCEECEECLQPVR